MPLCMATISAGPITGRTSRTGFKQSKWSTPKRGPGTHEAVYQSLCPVAPRYPAGPGARMGYWQLDHAKHAVHAAGRHELYSADRPEQYGDCELHQQSPDDDWRPLGAASSGHGRPLLSRDGR